ncbi:hypothetical protein LSH36_682g01073 [Paralvinella palmiformis]|uniref:UspA domain-containing protein n=1 Tax=Paralvinella palmiformis TaxID=53620 RepID=A0AAD9J3N8_9ANNE|nr:hypothetical protein LSH36_682g01073 [Paralvinella palmiformis]
MGGYLSARSAQTLLVYASEGDKSQMKNKSTIRDTVVIPIDSSKQAEVAFEWYLRHVHKPQNYVYMIHCEEIEHPTGVNFPDYTVTLDAIADKMEDAKKKGSSLVEKYNAKLKEKGIRGEVKAEIGRPGEVVVNMADKHHASMIVMGSRGLGLVRRTILGSVSEYVIHHTKVPVTIVPKETQSWFF